MHKPHIAEKRRTCRDAAGLLLMEGMLRNNRHRVYAFYQRIVIRCLDWLQMPEGRERALLILLPQNNLP